jgi:hypothetical protein
MKNRFPSMVMEHAHPHLAAKYIRENLKKKTSLSPNNYEKKLPLREQKNIPT